MKHFIYMISITKVKCKSNNTLMNGINKDAKNVENISDLKEFPDSVPSFLSAI